MPESLTLLVDNGSLEPAATLALRGLAVKLGARIGRQVEPVSLLHSSAVPAEKIGGIAAEILEPALERRLISGQNDFLLLPLFFGPSGALTDYLPARLAHLRGRHGKLQTTIAAPLFAAGDDRLARILADHVRASSDCRSLLAGDAGHLPTDRASNRLQTGPYKNEPTRVVVVDHGSPARAVVDVRNALAQQLGLLLGANYVVAAASMERRAGPEYDFAEPLLAGLLRQPAWNAGEVTIAMQFLLPGRHAGPNGDVTTICREAETASGGNLRTTLTALVAEHPLLVDILADRWRRAGL